MKTAPRYIAVFADPGNVSQYIVDCKVVVEKMTNNQDVPNPPVPLAQVSAHLDILATDEQEARKGGQGTAQKRDASLALVKSDMRLLKAYAQSVCDNRPPAEAWSIIHNIGMTASYRAGPTKEAVAAKRGEIPNQVVLAAKAVPRPAVYCWQVSTDGATWSDLPETFNSRTKVEGLKACTLYYFRLRTMTPAGFSDWSQVVSVVAL